MYYMLWIRANKLKNFKFLGKTNSLVALFLKNPITGMYVNIGMTECVFHDDNPQYSVPIGVNRKHMKVLLPEKKYETAQGCWEQTRFVWKLIREYLTPTEEDWNEETFKHLLFVVCDIDKNTEGLDGLPGKITHDNIISSGDIKFEDCIEVKSSVQLSFGAKEMGQIVILPEKTDEEALKENFS